MKSKSGERTLLASVALSAPGPIAVGIGLLVGRSSTQLADFIRRTAEFTTIVVSWAVFRLVQAENTLCLERRLKLEAMANLVVGLAMCLGGVAMILIAFLSLDKDRGNVLPGLVIAALGVIANAWFWLRYSRLDQAEPNAILATQGRLYRAKTLVDCCVTLVLIFVAVIPNSPAIRYIDAAGSILIAVFLTLSGARILVKRKVERTEGPVPDAENIPHPEKVDRAPS